MIEQKYKPIKIPKNAKLKDIIDLLNLMNLTANVNDKIMSSWLYDHKDWLNMDVEK